MRGADGFDPMAGKGRYTVSKEDRAALRRFHAERYPASARAVLAHGTVYDFVFAHARDLDWNAIVPGLHRAGFLVPGPSVGRASFWYVRPEFETRRAERERCIAAIVGRGWRIAVEHVILRDCCGLYRPGNFRLARRLRATTIGGRPDRATRVAQCFRPLEPGEGRAARSARRWRRIVCDLPIRLRRVPPAH